MEISPTPALVYLLFTTPVRGFSSSPFFRVIQNQRSLEWMGSHSFFSFCPVELSILCVSDTEVLKFNWTYPSISCEQERAPFEFHYSPKLIASANKSYCYQCASLADNQQLLAIATSKDNILLYNIESAQQVFEYVGHTG